LIDVIVFFRTSSSESSLSSEDENDNDDDDVCEDEPKLEKLKRQPLKVKGQLKLCNTKYYGQFLVLIAHIIITCIDQGRLLNFDRNVKFEL